MLQCNVLIVLIGIKGAGIKFLIISIQGLIFAVIGILLYIFSYFLNSILRNLTLKLNYPSILFKIVSFLKSVRECKKQNRKHHLIVFFYYCFWLK